MNFTNWLALYVITLSFVYLFWVSYMDVQGKVTNNISEIKMSVIGLLTACVMFYFASSHSSKKKDEEIEDLKNGNK